MPRPQQDVLDIDILVIMGDFARWVSVDGITPNLAMDHLETVVAGHGTYNRIGPESDSPTVSLEYRDGIKMELVPAYRDNIGYDSQGNPTNARGRGYWIPRRGSWVYADYDYDASYVSRLNQSYDNLLIPTIKMLKAAKRNIFPDLGSFHLEVLAALTLPEIVPMVEKLDTWMRVPLLVSSFFLLASTRISNPVALPGSSSPVVMTNLSNQQYSDISGWFGTLNKLMYNGLVSADVNLALGAFSIVFGEPFPEHA